MAFHVAMRNMSPCRGGEDPSEDGDAIAPANCARTQMIPPRGGRAEAPLKESRRVLMASQMAMRNMSPCEGVKPARGPDEACLRSPGELNQVATHRWRASTNEVRASVPPEGGAYPPRGPRCGWVGKERTGKEECDPRP